MAARTNHSSTRIFDAQQHPPQAKRLIISTPTSLPRRRPPEQRTRNPHARHPEWRATRRCIDHSSRSPIRRPRQPPSTNTDVCASQVRADVLQRLRTSAHGHPARASSQATCPRDRPAPTIRAMQPSQKRAHTHAPTPPQPYTPQRATQRTPRPTTTQTRDSAATTGRARTARDEQRVGDGSHSRDHSSRSRTPTPTAQPRHRRSIARRCLGGDNPGMSAARALPKRIRTPTRRNANTSRRRAVTKETQGAVACFPSSYSRSPSRSPLSCAHGAGATSTAAQQLWGVAWRTPTSTEMQTR
jgi:hypothetical protein